jgi:Type II secretion system (T2SS), protein E, N-terminal domain
MGVAVRVSKEIPDLCRAGCRRTRVATGGRDLVRTLRIGDLLVQSGVLSPKQRDHILNAQKTRGKPFGALAEELFGVTQEAVESAWAQQFANISALVDPRAMNIHPRALKAIERRQAWQFRILPLDTRPTGFVACTTQLHLPRALKFACWKLGQECQFVLADPNHLAEAMQEHYPMAGMGLEIITGTGIAV